MKTDQKNVTLVTRNDKGAILWVVVYAACLYFLANPHKLGELEDWWQAQKKRLAFRRSVWASMEAIQRLPDTHER